MVIARTKLEVQNITSCGSGQLLCVVIARIFVVALPAAGISAVRDAVYAQLFYLDAAAEILEWPLTMLRKATIPLLERECYSRPWFLAALVSLTAASRQHLSVSSIHVLVCVNADKHAEVLASSCYELRGDSCRQTWCKCYRLMVLGDCEEKQMELAECCAGVCPACRDAVPPAELICNGHGALCWRLACGAGCMGNLQGQQRASSECTHLAAVQCQA